MPSRAALVALLSLAVVTARPAEPNLPAERTAGQLEIVATLHGPMPTGVTVSHDGRVFVNFPRWGDDVPFTVAELRDGKPIAYPSAAFNRCDGGNPAECLVSVQSVVVDPANRLWLLDTGRPAWQPAEPGGPKLVGVDLDTDEPFQTITIPRGVALPDTYLNDVRFDLTRGSAGMAYVSDSSRRGGIIVVDLASGESWRKLSGHESVRAEEQFVPVVEGRALLRRPKDQPPAHLAVGSDGIAIMPNGRLFYTPLSGRRLYSVSLAALSDRTLADAKVAATVQDHGDRGFASDGLESDAAGNVYLTNYEDNAIARRKPDGSYETIVHDPRALWPDTLALATNGYLYFTANQLHRQAQFHNGKDLREKPYAVFRVRIGQQPVLLK